MINEEREVKGNERIEKLMRLAYRINMIVPKMKLIGRVSGLTLSISGNIIGELYTLVGSESLLEEDLDFSSNKLYNSAIEKAEELLKEIYSYVSDNGDVKHILDPLISGEDCFISSLKLYTIKNKEL